jgi:hypothetical protein
MSSKSVFLLQIGLKYPPEHCDREIKAVRRALGKQHPVMNGKHHVAFVTTAYGTPSKLMERLASVLEVDAFENYWVTIPAKPVAAKFGGIDALPFRVQMAYAAVDAGPSKNFAKREMLVVQNFSKGAPRKMGIKRGRDRHPAK